MKHRHNGAVLIGKEAENKNTHNTIKPEFIFGRDELKAIFDIMQLSPANLDEAVASTQPWARGDHSRPGFDYGDVLKENDSALRELFTGLGMQNESLLVDTEVDDVIMYGAIYAGTLRRLELLNRMVRQHGFRPKRIILAGGERRGFIEKETSEYLGSLTVLRSGTIDDPWLDQITSEMVPVDQLWETELLRIAAAQQMGHMDLVDIHHRGDFDGPPSQAIASMQFDWEGIPVYLHHTLKVPRPNGAPRHTTEECAKDYIRHYLGDIEQSFGHRIALIGAQPHIHRMLLSNIRMFNDMGRGDVELLAAGSRAEGIGVSMYLGEIARWLYEEKVFRDNGLLIQ
jgi:hypothetical protein